MSQTISADNFSPINIKQYGQLDADCLAGQSVATVKDSNNYTAGDVVWLGRRGQQQCERLVIASVNHTTQTLTFSTNVEFLHHRGNECIAVYCDQVQFMSAPDVNGSAPALNTYTVLPNGTITIDPENSATVFSDPNGSAAVWYTYVFKNSITSGLTDLAQAVPVRGYGLNHYVAIADIRLEAGFKNAKYVTDADIEMYRATAEDEVNAMLTRVTALPLPLPLPMGIATITRRLAAGYLMQGGWGPMAENKAVGTDGTTKIAWAQARLQALANGTEALLDANGNNMSQDYSYSFYPDDTSTAGPAFARNQVF